MNRFSSAVLLAAAVLTVAAACRRQKPEVTGKFTVRVGLEAAGTRTTLSDVSAGKCKVYWADGDAISVNGVASEALSGTAPQSQSAEFTFGSDPGEPLKAVYPATLWQSDGRVNFPSERSISDGAFESPMYGYSTEASLTMHHLCANIKVNFSAGSDTHKIAYVEFRSNGSEAVSGTFGIDYTTGELTPVSVSTKVRTIIGKSIGAEPLGVYLAVPAGTFSSGFTVRIVDEKGHYMDVSRAASANLYAGFLANMAAVTFEPTGTLVGVDIPGTESDPLYTELVLTNENINQMDYSLSGGVYSITTSGTDPYVFTEAFSSAIPSGQVMLSFDYTSEKDIDDLQLYFPPLSEARSVHLGGLSATGSYKSVAFDISSSMSSFSWGAAGDFLRIDLGTVSDNDVKIKGLCIREKTSAEKKPSQIAEGILSYLDGSYSASVSSVTVGASTVTVTGSVPSASGYYLAEVTPYEELSQIVSFPSATEISATSFNISLPRSVSRDGYTYDRLLSKWAVVNGSGEICSFARFADEVSLSKAAPALQLPSSKKGLGAYEGSTLQTSDLDALGITSVTENILLNGVINTEATGSFTTPFVYGGTTYYIDASYVAGLDERLVTCQEKGIVVAAILLVANSSTSAGTAVMKHPECTGGYYSMPNMTTAASVNLYAAVLNYLASRYNGGSYGRIHHYIMHNEVDQQIIWTNMGQQPELRYANEYVKSMRMASLIAHQYDPNAAVLTSLTHSWAEAEGQYASRDLLDDINALSSAEGDFWWGVGYHAYPQILFQPAFWSGDTESTYSMDSKYVTFKNLEVLSAWALTSANKYKGSTKRLVWLSENGTNAMTYSDDHLSQQAAGVAWMWKKVSRLEGIDAVQWHNWRDNPEEGLNLGLRKNTDNGSAVKPSYAAYQAAGTSSEDSVFAPYLSVIGISSWDQIYNDL